MNIKRFESFIEVFESNSDDLYTKISLTEWLDSITEFENFTSWEANKLLMIDNKPIPEIIFKYKQDLNINKKYYFIVDIDKYGCNIFFTDVKSPNDFLPEYTRFLNILKMCDGWFLVDFNMGDHVFYKCDQFDGLMKLLKDYKFY